MRVFGMVSTRGTHPYTELALKSFVKHTELRPFDRFILIDNDNTFKELPEALKDIGSIETPAAPRSFAQNLNEVMVAAFKERADLFFLNNDLVFTPDWLVPLLTPEIAIFSPFSNREIQHKSKDFTWKNSLAIDDYLSRTEEFEELLQFHKTRVGGTHQVLTLPFFCVKIPYFVYDQIGPLDEGYGKGGGEDYDYCLRAAEKDIPVKYCAHSYVLHFNGKSTWSGSESPEETNERKKKYSAIFEKKWGALLTRILIDEDPSAMADIPEAAELMKRGALKELVIKLKNL